ncbi:MAG: energy transducer TonB [Bacteroidales bacterium]|nr:energy transducer TonB [Bacteroidales bacterium]
MIAKKTDKGNLENKRGLFLLVGFAVVLALIYAGFELFANEDKAPAFELNDDEFITVVDDDVIATDQTPPPPPEAPQQQQEVVLNIVENNIQVNTDISFDVEFNEDEVIVDNTETEVEVVDEGSEEDPPMMFTEEMPEFPGGDEALLAFLTREIQYPEVARNNGITGTVLIEFVVEKDGRVSNAKVKVPLFPECDKEAVRGVMAMPKWKPGKNMGKPVRCFFQVPVTFRQ